MKNKTYHPRGMLVDGYPVKKHPSYFSWSAMKSRCNNVNDFFYENYGGRGIAYCARWEDFSNFARDMGIRPGNNYSIERVDNEKGYSPENCKWGTRHEQSMNRRKFKNNTTGFRGVTKVVKCGRFRAQVQFKKVRYLVGGTFATAEEAKTARDKILAMIRFGKDMSGLLERPARYDSTTGVKGITPHGDGGYIVRITRNEKRIYLGYFQSFEDAKRVLDNAKS
jgi:hypothetical protein